MLQVINIPISDDDIIKTVSSLPRTEETSGLIDVTLRRRMKYKKPYRKEFQNKAQLEEALDYLIHNHESYKGMKKIDIPDQLDVSDEEPDSEGSDVEMVETEAANIEDNPNLLTTTLIPEDPELNVFVNASTKPVEKKTKLLSKSVHVVAPGEGKVPTYWLREKDFDTAAFPRHHPDGQYGLAHKRDAKLSLQEYFTQRLFNVDKRFATDPDYLFIAQYYVERNALEKQIDISYQKGKIVNTEHGTKVIQPNNVFSIFKQIPGTPAYWQAFRNDLFAMLEQHGPFHLFFTLSCAEMRWPEVAASILQSNGCTVTFSSSPWDGLPSSIQIDGIPLDEFLEIMPNRSFLFQDEVILITQMFDNRVKSFINNVFKSSAIKYYTFRIEFQVRGM